MNAPKKIQVVCSQCKHPLIAPMNLAQRSGPFIRMQCRQPGCGSADWYLEADFHEPQAEEKAEDSQVQSFDFLLDRVETQ
jgi:hypothetical protein